MRFIPPIAVAATLILTSPVIGQLRAALQNAFPAEYHRILVAAVAGCVGLAIGAALLRIRERRALRYALVAVALAIGVTYGLLSRTGDAAVDAIERFHFVEYGLVTLLFYFAWRRVSDASLFILPVLAGLLVGILEEWLQWFVPARVGELRDIVLNLWAILCGLLFSVALSPPARFSLSLSPASSRQVRRGSALVLLVFAMFFHSAHLGHQVDDPAGGPFRSIYSAEQLAEIASERAQRWRAHPPLTWSRYSREDQFFSEAIALVRLRNQCWAAADAHCAWRANVILERYYAPVLDTASYVSATGLRWPADQRADAERLVKTLQSDSTPYLDGGIYTWPKWWFWTIVLAVIAMLLLL